MDSLGTPQQAVEAKKRKLEEILSPPGTKPPSGNVDFVQNMKFALLDEDIQNAFKIILGERDALSKEVTVLKNKVATLEKRLDDHDAYSRRNCLIISNVPEPNEGEEESTDKVVFGVSKALGVPLELGELSRSHRLPRSAASTKPRDIVFRVVTYNKRQQLYLKRFKLKSTDFKDVYINEHLTKKRKRLFYDCRMAKKDARIIDTWTQDGRIMVKYLDQGTQREIKCTVSSKEDLDAVAMAPREDGNLDLQGALNFIG